MTRSEFIKGIKVGISRLHRIGSYVARMEIAIGKPGRENVHTVKVIRYDKVISSFKFDLDTMAFRDSQEEKAEEMWQEAIDQFPDGLNGIEVL